MEEALAAHLAENTALMALLPNEALRWGSREGDTCVALYVIDAPDDWHLKGSSGVTPARIQADCWASTFLAAKAIGDALKAALPDIGQVIDGVKFLGCVPLSIERDRTGDEPNIRHRTRIDIRVTTKPAT